MASISVIVPALNEESRIADALQSVWPAPGDELIVVDGGSADGTASVAATLADRVIAASRGRAMQLSAGAAAARGDVLLFLHADTKLPDGALDAVRRALADDRVVGGAFRLRIDSPRRALRLVEWAVNWRSRLRRCPYGDQAVFVRRAVFEAMGGFKPLPIMEDLDLVRRLRRRGRLVLLREAVTTSARRWRANGVVRTTLVNWVAATMFLLGRSPHSIRRVYDRWLPSAGDGRDRSTHDDRADAAGASSTGVATSSLAPSASEQT